MARRETDRNRSQETETEASERGTRTHGETEASRQPVHGGGGGAWRGGAVQRRKLVPVNRGLVDQNLGAHAINGQLSRQGVGSKTVRQTAVIARLYDRDKTDSHEAVITLAGKL